MLKIFLFKNNKNMEKYNIKIYKILYYNFIVIKNITKFFFWQKLMIIIYISRI